MSIELRWYTTRHQETNSGRFHSHRRLQFCLVVKDKNYAAIWQDVEEVEGPSISFADKGVEP